MPSPVLAERPAALPADELDLVRKTVAAGATDAELKLFLYDCSRRGVHPLDRLLHFTKRGGRYTPVTSIDFMRAQAAMSGEMAGSDDPVFRAEDESGRPLAALVTVYRLTQGQRFGYAATARWSEYCPDNAPMWKRMPFTMLGKCAEALALRKAFPQQLAGLYSREEMDQADKGGGNGYLIEAPAGVAASRPRASDEVAVAPDAYALTITSVRVTPTKNVNVTKAVLVLSDGREVMTLNPQITGLAEQCAQEACAIEVETKATKWGEDITALRRVRERTAREEPRSDDAPF